MIVAIFMAWLCGFALLCIGRERHQRDVLGRPLDRRHAGRAKVAGWCCLAAGYAAGIRSHGFGYGSLMSAGIATLTAACVIGTLAWFSRRR